MYKITGLICWLAILLLFSSAKAQQSGILTARVQDKYGNTLPGVTVILQPMPDTLKKVTTTNSDGIFKFDGLAYGRYLISFSYLGFEKQQSTITISAQNNTTTLPLIILLASNNTSLKEIAIKAKKDYLEHQTDRTVVNVAALISNSGANAAQALELAPGVSISETTISLRGREGVVIFIDDKPTYLSGKELMDYLKSLPAATLDKIEIMPVPPARYDASGTAGIINIKTKKEKTTGYNAMLNSGYSQGQKPKFTNSLNFNYRKKALNIFGNAGYALTENYYNVDWTRLYTSANATLSPLLQQHNFESSTTHSFSYRAGIDIDINSKTSISLIYSGNTAPYAEHGNYSLRFNQINGQPDSSIIVKSELRQRTSRNVINFNLKHQQAGNEWNVNLDYLENGTKSGQNSSSDTYLADKNFKSNYTLLSNNTFNAKLWAAGIDLSTKLASIKLNTGLQTTYSIRRTSGFYNNQIGNLTLNNDSLTNHFNNSENINSVYISLQKAYKQIELQAGLRAENTNASATAYSFKFPQGQNIGFNYTNLFPTVYLVYKLDSLNNNRLTLSAGRRINRPNYSDLNPSVFVFDRYTSFRGNPLLQPSYANNFELAYNYKSWFTAGLLYNNTSNQITSVYSLIGSAIVQNNINLDRVTSYGTYINPSLILTKWFTLNFYAQLSQMYYKGVLNNNEILDNHVLSFSGNGNGQFDLGKNWSAEISGLYRGKRSFGQGYYLPLWQVNSSIQKKLWDNRASISLTARDIFHSFIINRAVNVEQLQLSRIIHNDTQLIGINFSYKFGTAVKNRAHKSTIENEASRMN